MNNKHLEFLGNVVFAIAVILFTATLILLFWPKW